MNEFNTNYIISYFFVRNKSILEFELYYFKLMSSMRKFRIKIPNFLTMDFLEQKFKEVSNNYEIKNLQIRLIVSSNRDFSLDFLYKIKPFNDIYQPENPFEIEVFKDFNFLPGLVSTINYYRPEFNIAQIYALENNLNDVILLNQNKRIARTLFGDLFFINNSTLSFCSKEEGYSEQILGELVKNHFKNKGFELSEKQFSPFETQKADEIFIVSEEIGIIPINKIRNKEFKSEKINQILKYFY